MEQGNDFSRKQQRRYTLCYELCPWKAVKDSPQVFYCRFKLPFGSLGQARWSGLFEQIVCFWYLAYTKFAVETVAQYWTCFWKSQKRKMGNQNTWSGYLVFWKFNSILEHKQSLIRLFFQTLSDIINITCNSFVFPSRSSKFKCWINIDITT